MGMRLIEKGICRQNCEHSRDGKDYEKDSSSFFSYMNSKREADLIILEYLLRVPLIALRNLTSSKKFPLHLKARNSFTNEVT